MSVSNTPKTLLCLDTSTPACSVALLHERQIYHRFELASRDHTRLLLPMVDAVLKEAGISANVLDALAFTVGPGSFTGIRIGFGVAQGLAFGAELPVIPVSTLESMAVAAQVECEHPEGSLILPMLDARMDEIYWALFQVSAQGELQRVCDDSLNNPEDIQPELNDAPLHMFGDGWNYAERLTVEPASVNPEFYPDARAVLTIAVQKLAAGQLQQVDDVQPLYLRDKITWKKRQRLREQVERWEKGNE